MYYSIFFFFSSRRRHTRSTRDWSSDVCSSDLLAERLAERGRYRARGDVDVPARDERHDQPDRLAGVALRRGGAVDACKKGERGEAQHVISPRPSSSRPSSPAPSSQALSWHPPSCRPPFSWSALSWPAPSSSRRP